MPTAIPSSTDDGARRRHLRPPWEWPARPLGAATALAVGAVLAFSRIVPDLSRGPVVCLFRRATGLDLTFERHAQRVMREVLEPADPVPQMSGDKSNEQVTTPNQASWKKVLREVEEMSDRALRVTGLAYREDAHGADSRAVERSMVWVGLVGMRDPPRAEVPSTRADPLPRPAAWRAGCAAAPARP